ncbi:MAG: ATP-binding cassette domain-containing protein [Rhodocyclaceae bacterium]
MSSVVDMRNIRTLFGKTVVHDGVNLSVERGDLMALVGGSGSGKTTLLRQMAALMVPTAGRVMLFGEPIMGGSRVARMARRRRFGMMFQQGALFSAFNVFENVAFPLKELGGLTAEEIHALVMSRLALVELTPEHARLMPAELSGGMVKRVALARALALEPELLLLDEPTAGLDPDRSAAFVSLVRSLHQQLGLTVVFVTHDLDTLAALSTRVAVLAEHRILACDALENVMRVDHPFINNFFRLLRPALRAAER